MSHDSITMKELKAIVDWVHLTEDVREFSLKYGEVELFMSRNQQATGAQSATITQPSQVQVSAESVVSADTPAATETSAPAPATQAPQTVVVSEDDLASDEVLVKAPMVGTFYSSPKPGDPPFVSVGDVVQASSVVGIVEVMKLMNNLEAKVDGVVAQILVENEQAVEYGQPLMVIKRNG